MTSASGPVRSIPVTPSAAQAFPGLSVLTLRATVGDRQALAAAAEEGWRALYERWHDKASEDLLEHRNVQGYVELCLALGLDPDRNPPSIVALVNRGLRQQPPGSWPRINPIVDLVNTMAVRSMTSLGVFDERRLEGEVQLALTDGGEPFLALGASKPKALRAGELVLRDDARVLSLFSRRDGVHQAVQATTTDVLVLGCVVPGVDSADVADALAATQRHLTDPPLATDAP